MRAAKNSRDRTLRQCVTHSEFGDFWPALTQVDYSVTELPRAAIRHALWPFTSSVEASQCDSLACVAVMAARVSRTARAQIGDQPCRNPAEELGAFHARELTEESKGTL